MPIIDMAGLDTQTAPMEAISSVLQDYHEGHINSVETLVIIGAIVTEWKQ